MFISKLKVPFKTIYILYSKKPELAEETTPEYIQFIAATKETDSLVSNAYENNLVTLFPPCFRCHNLHCSCDNNALFPNQVASFFSHSKIWEKIAAEKSGIYLISDEEYLFGHTSLTTNYFYYWKINTLVKKTLSNSEEPYILKLIKQPQSDKSNSEAPCAYAINPKMAQILLKNLNKINTTLNDYIDTVSKNCIQKTLVLPHISCSHNKESSEYHIQKAIHRKLLIIGHPRTGTAYTGTLLNSFGLDIGHEKMGNDGIVSWMFTVKDLFNPFFQDEYAKSRYFTSFEHTIMCVRDPLTAIASIVRENTDAEISLAFRRKHILKEFKIDIAAIESPFEMAIASYYYWSKINLNNKPELIVRIEYDDKKLFEYVEKCGYPVQYISEKLPPKNINSDKKWKGKITPKPKIDQSGWLEIDKKYRSMLNELCGMFGYNYIFDKSLETILRA